MKNITKINLIKIARIYINFFENGYNIRVKVKFLDKIYLSKYQNTISVYLLYTLGKSIFF